MAQQNIYIQPGSIHRFTDTANTPDSIITLSAVAAGAGWISVQWDRGAGAKPATYSWVATTKWVASPVVGEQLRLYKIAGDGTFVAGNFGTASATVAAEAAAKGNCEQFGSVQATAAASQLEVNFGEVRIVTRYVSIMAWNGSAAKALTTSTTDHVIILTEIPDAIQPLA